jgi:hypothetical protein
MFGCMPQPSSEIWHAAETLASQKLLIWISHMPKYLNDKAWNKNTILELHMHFSLDVI